MNFSSNFGTRLITDLKKLSELCIVKMLLPVMSEMQSNKLTVPVERDLKMNKSLFKYFFDICFGEGKTTGEP